MNLVDRFFGKAVVPNNRSPLTDAVLHGPTYQGTNIIRDSILGRGPSPLLFPLVPDFFPMNLQIMLPGTTQLIATAPVGGFWLCRIQAVDGALTNSDISLGDLDTDFGAITLGSPMAGIRGPTPLFYDPQGRETPLNLLPGGIFFKENTRVGIRAEDPVGAMETVFLFSFATRGGQITPTRLAL